MKNQPDTGQALDLEDSDQDGASLADLSGVLVAQWKTLLVGSMAAALIGLGCSWIMPKTYLARTVIMPPQQQQQNMAGALSSLGALAGLAGAAGLKNTTDQYIALMQSSTVSDRLIDRFGLMKAYQEEFRVDARKELLKNVFIGAGKKDGLITIEVEDRDPDKAAKMANAYVDELRLMTNTLAVSEAQQRRKFFELKMNETKSALTQAQIALQSSGVSPGLLKAEPKAAAEGYARIRAEVTAAEVRLQTLLQMLTERSPEVQQQRAQLDALRTELARQERKGSQQEDAEYIGRYRDYRYQETLFEIFAKQYELARTDEAREGALIQVVDVATEPEKKYKPKRWIFAAVGFALGFLVFGVRAMTKGMKPSLSPVT